MKFSILSIKKIALLGLAILLMAILFVGIFYMIRNEQRHRRATKQMLQVFSEYSPYEMITLSQASKLTNNKYPQTAAKNLQRFYKAPSYSQFMEILHAIPTDALKDQENYPFLQIYITMIIYTHPSYIKRILKQVNTTSPSLRDTLLLNGINAARSNANHLIDGINNNVKLYTPKMIKNFKVYNDAESFGMVFAAYYATGEIQYLKKYLTYFNQHTALLLEGYELTKCSPIRRCCINNAEKNSPPTSFSSSDQLAIGHT